MSAIDRRQFGLGDSLAPRRSLPAVRGLGPTATAITAASSPPARILAGCDLGPSRLDRHSSRAGPVSRCQHGHPTCQ